MNPGDNVFHSRLGNGRIIRVILRGGRRGAWVDFGPFMDWVAYDEMEVRDGPGGTRVAGQVAGTDPLGDDDIAAIDEDIVDARRAILALKLGQVPENYVLELSAGIDRERSKLETAIDSVADMSTASILVKGTWGTGKTHLLTMLRALATRHGLATASVILDGEGVTLSDPMRLMADILVSLRFPGEAVSDSIMSRLASFRRRHRWVRGLPTRQLNDFVINPMLQIDQRYFDEPEVTDVIADYLMLRLPASQANIRLRQLGYGGLPLGPLTARSTDHRADRFCDLLREWVQVCSFAEEGARGLVVVVDELDVDYFRKSGDTNRDREFRRRRRMLLEAFGSLLQVERVPLLLAFGVADDVWGDNAVEELREKIGGIIEIEAPSPDSEQTRQIGRRLLRLYARAYPDRIAGVDQMTLRRLLDEFAERHQADMHIIPRTFVRGTLELLDVAPDL